MESAVVPYSSPEREIKAVICFWQVFANEDLFYLCKKFEKWISCI